MGSLMCCFMDTLVNFVRRMSKKLPHWEHSNSGSGAKQGPFLSFLWFCLEICFMEKFRCVFVNIYCLRHLKGFRLVSMRTNKTFF